MWQQLDLASELASDLWDTVDWGRKWLFGFSAENTQLVSFDLSNNSSAIDVKMNGLFLKKNHLLRCWNYVSLRNWIGALTLPLLLKLSQRKLGALIHSVKFLFSEVDLSPRKDLYPFTIKACMQYCCHVWAGACNCYLDMSDKLQKWVCRTFGLSLAASLELLGHGRNIASLSFFHRYLSSYLYWLN